jgi:hypothetical protein
MAGAMGVEVQKHSIIEERRSAPEEANGGSKELM